MVPQFGFRFNPTDEELIEILHCKSSGQEMPFLNFITPINIYENEPQLLQWNETAAVGKDERYYYCRRENGSREVAGRGWWKATSHVKQVHVSDNLVGLKRPLTFHRYRDHRTNRNNAIKTNWIMHEYTLLHSHQTEWRICKVKYKGRPSLQEEMENMRQTQYSSPNDFEAPNSNVAQSNSNGQQNPLPAVQYSTIPTDHNNYAWLHPTGSDGTNLFEEFEPIEEPFPDIWSWQN